MLFSKTALVFFFGIMPLCNESDRLKKINKINRGELQSNELFVICANEKPAEPDRIPYRVRVHKGGKKCERKVRKFDSVSVSFFPDHWWEIFFFSPTLERNVRSLTCWFVSILMNLLLSIFFFFFYIYFIYLFIYLRKF